MKPKFLTSLIAIFFISTSVLAQEYLTFDITNNTGVDIMSIQVSESNKSLWGDDIIETDVFMSGDTFEVILPITNQTICAHDLKVTDFEDTYAYLTGADLCIISNITLFFDNNGTLTWSLE